MKKRVNNFSWLANMAGDEARPGGANRLTQTGISSSAKRLFSVGVPAARRKRRTKLGQRVTLTLAAAVTIPLALTASPASAMILEKDVSWSPAYSYYDPSTGQEYDECYYDHAAPDLVCNIPTDEPLVTQGTWLKAYADSSTFANPASVKSAQIQTSQGHEQAIPLSSTVLRMSAGDSNWVVGWKMPSALNWDVEQDLNNISGDWPQLQLNGQESVGDQYLGRFTATINFTPSPLSPSSLGAKRSSSTSATISWGSPVYGMPDGYSVKRTSSSGTWSTTVGSDIRTFTFSHLTAGVTYTLSVQADDAVVNNGAGPVATAVAAGTTTALGAPTAVTAQRSGQGSATITWSAPSTLGGKTITGYKVARDGKDIYGGGPYSKVVPTGTRAFTMNYLKLGSTYKLSVKPIYSGGVGPAVSVPVFIG